MVLKLKAVEHIFFLLFDDSRYYSIPKLLSLLIFLFMFDYSSHSKKLKNDHILL
jgi:hypothetical protein